MKIKFTEEFLTNSDNWEDFGLSEYFSENRFEDWIDVSNEARRILKCEEYSPMSSLIATLCAASFGKAVAKIAALTGVDEQALIEVLMPPNIEGLQPGCGWDALAVEVAKAEVAMANV